MPRDQHTMARLNPSPHLTPFIRHATSRHVTPRHVTCNTLQVMDSVTFHFRQDFADMAARTRQLAQMAQQLMQLAGRQEVAVSHTGVVQGLVHPGEAGGGCG